MKRSIESVLSYLLAFLLSFPVFISIGGGGAISLSKSIWLRQGEITLPLAVILVVCLLVLLLAKYFLGALELSTCRSGLPLLSVIFIFMCTFSLLVGMWGGASQEAVLFYLQVVSPLSLLFLGVYLARIPQRVRPLLLTMLAGGAVAAWGLFLQSSLERGWQATLMTEVVDHIGPFYIWGIRDYFPLAIAYLAVLGVALFLTKAIDWKLFVVVVSPMLMLLPITWSRGAVATLALAVAILIILSVFRKQMTGRTLLFSGLLVVLAAVVLLGPTEAIVVTRLRIDVEKGEFLSLSERWERWSSSLDTISDSPLFGIGFNPERSTEGATGRVFRSHNQYLDLGLKAGLSGLACFLVLILWALRVLFYRYNHATTQFEYGIALGVLVGWVAVVSISNMLQINFGQPYTGNMLWFTLGLVEGYFVHKGNTVRDPSREVTIAEARSI